MLNSDYGMLIIYHQREQEIVQQAEQHRILYHPIEFLRELHSRLRLNHEQN
jgi:hypothetical protein